MTDHQRQQLAQEILQELTPLTDTQSAEDCFLLGIFPGELEDCLWEEVTLNQRTFTRSPRLDELDGEDSGWPTRYH